MTLGPTWSRRTRSSSRWNRSRWSPIYPTWVSFPACPAFPACRAFPTWTAKDRWVVQKVVYYDWFISTALCVTTSSPTSYWNACPTVLLVHVATCSLYIENFPNRCLLVPHDPLFLFLFIFEIATFHSDLAGWSIPSGWTSTAGL